MTVEALVADGLPDASNSHLRLVLKGLPEDTRAAIRVNDQSLTSQRINGELVLDLPAGSDLTDATLEIVQPNGTITRITSADHFSDGKLTVDAKFDVAPNGGTGSTRVRAFGTGFVPGSPIEISLHSDPIRLATIKAGPDGSFDENVTLPSAVEPGEHRVLLTGKSADGPISGSWHFAVNQHGAVERVGDPPVEAAVAGAGLQAGAIEAAALAGVTEVGAPDVATTPSTQQNAAGASAPIDGDTGLAIFTPADKPKEAVKTAVETFALLSLLGSGGSLLAAGFAAMPMGAPAGGGNSAGGSSDSAGGAGNKGKRGKGKVTAGKASKLGAGADGTAWGDRSRTWRWPLTTLVDRLGVRAPKWLYPVSPLAARVVADGSTLRAIAGSGSLVAPVVGALLGVVAAANSGGHAVAPTVGIVIAIALLGIVDAFSGFVATVVFALAVTAAGGLHSADSVRSLLGLGSIWMAAPLIAGGARSFRRHPATNAIERWQAIGEVVMGSLLSTWSIHAVVSSLPALSGLDMPIARRADLVASVVLVGLVCRYSIERGAMRLFPERLALVTFEPKGWPSKRQQLISALVKGALFVFVILPYVGLRWQLWAIATLTMGPSLFGVFKHGFPNSARLHRVMPRGVPNTLLMMTVGAAIASALAARIADPTRLLVTSVVVLALPGFALSILGLFGRDGASPQGGWATQVVGAWVAFVAILKIRGILGASPWLPIVLVAPTAAWWFVSTHRNARATELANPKVASEANEMVVDAADAAFHRKTESTSTGTRSD